MPTKEQEKQALAKIEKILASLGNDPANSYVCRAFAGCVEDARENIENDFANSQKERADHYEAKYNEAKQEAREAREAYETLKARTIDTVARDNIWNFLNFELSKARHEAREAAIEMMEACDDTESNEYKTALHNAQASKRRAARIQEMIESIRGKDQ